MMMEDIACGDGYIVDPHDPYFGSEHRATHCYRNLIYINDDLILDLPAFLDDITD